MSQRMRQALLGKQTSRHNKFWLVAEYKRQGLFVEWKWAGAAWKSRLLFRFGPEENFVPSKSYEEDVVPTLKWDERKA